MKIKLNNVRLAFPALFEAKTVNGEGDPRFSAVFLMDPKHPQLEEVRKALKQVAKENRAKWETIYGQLEKKLNLCLMVTKAEYEGFPGNFFLNAANKARPAVIDRDRSPLIRRWPSLSVATSTR
jgi:hypothetical protein